MERIARLLVAGMDDIIRVLEAGSLSLVELRRIENILHGAQRRAEQDDTSRKSQASPADLVAEAAGNWGCYDDKDTPKAVAALNKLGVKLVEAVRSGKYPAIKSAIQAIIRKQRVWSRAGAADTEGREAIWSVVQAACAGTDLDPEHVWETCY